MPDPWVITVELVIGVSVWIGAGLVWHWMRKGEEARIIAESRYKAWRVSLRQTTTEHGRHLCPEGCCLAIGYAISILELDLARFRAMERTERGLSGVEAAVRDYCKGLLNDVSLDSPPGDHGRRSQSRQG